MPSDLRFDRLQQYLTDGWAIDPPIFVRPIWHSLADAHDAYHFILKRGNDLQLVVIPASPEVERFISDRHLSLNRL
ncbi:MAG: hypothetical protein M5U01_21130 [Ardenticatenaceae bacterium]|nr:hypothetical protein [Ardenticatenaceae bacterium]HBY93554.1 hypothetical protein [Chloroflexota bacterium]